MPTRPPKACASPGCSELVRSPDRRCARHEAARHRSIDERRRPSSQRYPKYWPKLSKRVLAGEVLCRHCAQRGDTTPAVEVDHIDGDTFNCAMSNLQPLCKPCHSRKTMSELNARRTR